MSAQTANKRKSLQINRTPDTKGPHTPKLQAQTPKSNQKQNKANITGPNSSKGNKTNKKRSLSPSNAVPAAKTPKLEKPTGNANLNVSKDPSIKKPKQGSSPGGKSEVQREAQRRRQTASRTNFQGLISRSTQGDLEARKVVAEKIKALESVPIQSKSAIRKLRVLKNSIRDWTTSEQNQTPPKTSDKKNTQQLKKKIEIDKESDEEESSEEENEMEVDAEDDSESEDESDEVAGESNKATLNEEEDDSESEDESDEVAVESNKATLNEEESDDEESDDAAVGDKKASADEEDSDDEDEEESEEDDEESEEDETNVEESKKQAITTNVLETVKNKTANKKQTVKETPVRSNYTIYVGNIDFKVTKADLTQHFEKVGKVAEVSWFQKPGSTFEHNGHAFIKFQDLESFEKSVTLHHTMLNNRRIIVLFTKEDGSRTSQIYALLNNDNGKIRVQGENFQKRQANRLQNNRQGDKFQNNRPGNKFQNNRPGNKFQNNRPGNKFQNNRPGNKFQNNRQGNNFQNRPKNNFQNKQGNNFNKGP